ncbi:Terminal nucleotidyltransferase 5C [Dissostichus eleginoides]|uniref:polynucleotide adenylyltransferase n=1 Tax=Dissostichus eleginoides TaxID=100907 RepID=A0AAD9BGK0_DISEL|nr:Terminal nucleotidyltransferase 5C [Dissostichus eleginoides]
MMELPTEKRFHNLTLEQMQALDKVLTEVIPIHGRGNFPTLQVRAKDIIRVVKDRLVERDIQVRDIRLNGATASYVLVRDNCLGYRDLDIIFGVELPREGDLQVIKEVVLGTLRDLLPCGVNRRKITCLTMKEAYVQKMVKVFNEHDRWSLISLSNNRSKTVGLRFVSSLRRQFEFSVDSFQIILDRMLESYWETERKQVGKLALNAGNLSKRHNEDEKKKQEQSSVPREVEPDVEKDSNGENRSQDETVPVLEEELPGAKVSVWLKSSRRGWIPRALTYRRKTWMGSKTFIQQKKLCLRYVKKKEKRKSYEELSASQAPPTAEKSALQEVHCVETTQFSRLPTRFTEFSFPPPAKKTCSTSQNIVPDYCPSPKLQRKMSRKLISKPENWSLLTDLSDLTTPLFPPIEIPKPLQRKPSLLDSAQVHGSNVLTPKSEALQTLSAPTCGPVSTLQDGTGSNETVEQTVKPKHSRKPPDLETQSHTYGQPQINDQTPEAVQNRCGAGSWVGAAGEPTITVEAECMYGDFDQAMDHLRLRLIATHKPEEIRGGGLLKYSDLLVRNFRPASETEIKSLERYMCSRFFIDFPDVSEQQRKIEAYLQCHFIGNEETSKYDYLMTLRRVIDQSTVCLMGHERRQTLNMITVLALRVLGEQNAIPNTANVTCFYQPAPYMAEPIYSSYFITQAQPPLVYHPYPLQVHVQTGLV